LVQNGQPSLKDIGTESTMVTYARDDQRHNIM
jgi:hypothetical protein